MLKIGRGQLEADLRGWEPEAAESELIAIAKSLDGKPMKLLVIWDHKGFARVLRRWCLHSQTAMIIDDGPANETGCRATLGLNGKSLCKLEASSAQRARPSFKLPASPTHAAPSAMDIGPTASAADTPKGPARRTEDSLLIPVDVEQFVPPTDSAEFDLDEVLRDRHATARLSAEELQARLEAMDDDGALDPEHQLADRCA